MTGASRGRGSALREVEIDAETRRRFAVALERAEVHGACLLWPGSTCTAGYGRMMIGGRRIGAHRLAWVLAEAGREIPPHHVVRHLCDGHTGSRRCVNPAHLAVGTYRQNWQDMVASYESARLERERLEAQSTPVVLDLDDGLPF